MANMASASMVGDTDGKRCPWATRAIGENSHITLEALQSGLTIGLIATPRAEFQTCVQHEELAIVVDRNRRNAFDFLPVVASDSRGADSSDRIVGLLEIAPLM